jgi:hypothetical protein
MIKTGDMLNVQHQTRHIELTRRERDLSIKGLAMLVAKSADPDEVLLAYETCCIVDGFARKEDQ